MRSFATARALFFACYVTALSIVSPCAPTPAAAQLCDNTLGRTDTIDTTDDGIAAVVSPERWYGLEFPVPATTTYISTISFALFHTDLTYVGLKGLQPL